MKKHLGIWIFAAVVGLSFVLLLNASPLSRLGVSVSLPSAWQNAPVSDYNDSSCQSRHPEGLPFAIKRPNKTQTCTFDINKLALLLNAGTGVIFGLLVFAIGQKHRHSS